MEPDFLWTLTCPQGGCVCVCTRVVVVIVLYYVMRHQERRMGCKPQLIQVGLKSDFLHEYFQKKVQVLPEIENSKKYKLRSMIFRIFHLPLSHLDRSKSLFQPQDNFLIPGFIQHRRHVNFSRQIIQKLRDFLSISTFFVLFTNNLSNSLAGRR